MRANGGRAPTLEEFLDLIYPDGMPEEGVTLEIDIPVMIANLEETAQEMVIDPTEHATASLVLEKLPPHPRGFRTPIS